MAVRPIAPEGQFLVTRRAAGLPDDRPGSARPHVSSSRTRTGQRGIVHEPGGLQLSPVQIIAALLATLTGAILASYLGVGGTLVGAAVGSIASTTGTEVYRHYLRRSQERLKAAGEVLRHRQADSGQHARHAAGQPTGGAQLGAAATETLAASRAARGTGDGRYNGRGQDRSPDASETQIIPVTAEASAWQRRAGAAGPAGPTAGEHATGELSDGPARTALPWTAPPRTAVAAVAAAGRGGGTSASGSG